MILKVLLQMPMRERRNTLINQPRKIHVQTIFNMEDEKIVAVDTGQDAVLPRDIKYVQDDGVQEAGLAGFILLKSRKQKGVYVEYCKMLVYYRCTTCKADITKGRIVPIYTYA